MPAFVCLGDHRHVVCWARSMIRLSRASLESVLRLEGRSDEVSDVHQVSAGFERGGDAQLPNGVDLNAQDQARANGSLSFRILRGQTDLHHRTTLPTRDFQNGERVRSQLPETRLLPLRRIRHLGGTAQGDPQGLHGLAALARRYKVTACVHTHSGHSVPPSVELLYLLLQGSKSRTRTQPTISSKEAFRDGRWGICCPAG